MIIENADSKLRKKYLYLCLQSIQHTETHKTFYQKKLFPDGELEFWNNFLENNMQTTTKANRYSMGIATKVLKIGLIIHPINDWKK